MFTSAFGPTGFDEGPGATCPPFADAPERSTGGIGGGLVLESGRGVPEPRIAIPFDISSACLASSSAFVSFRPASALVLGGRGTGCGAVFAGAAALAGAVVDGDVLGAAAGVAAGVEGSGGSTAGALAEGTFATVGVTGGGSPPPHAITTPNGANKRTDEASARREFIS
jgi:hypothetical protein